MFIGCELKGLLALFAVGILATLLLLFDTGDSAGVKSGAQMVDCPDKDGCIPLESTRTGDTEEKIDVVKRQQFSQYVHSSSQPVKSVRDVEGENSNSLIAIIHASDLLVEEGRYLQMVDLSLEKSIRLNDTDHSVLIQDLKYKLQRIEEALSKEWRDEELYQLYQKLAVAMPDDLQFVLKLAYWQAVTGRYDQAEQTLSGVANDPVSQQQAEHLREYIARIRD